MSTTQADRRNRTEAAQQASVARSVATRDALTDLRTVKGLFLLAALASFLFSVYLWFLVDREQGLFVGLWVPSILGLGSLLLSGKGGGR